MNHKRWLALAPFLLAACASVEVRQPEPEAAAEVRAQMQVKAALLESGEVAAAPIRVEYEGGSLILRGFVESAAEQRRAEAIAREAQPGVEIVNELEVWGAQRRDTAAASARNHRLLSPPHHSRSPGTSVSLPSRSRTQSCLTVT